MEINELFPENGEPQRIYCGECEAHMILVFEDFDEQVTGVHFAIGSFPMLKCPNCAYTALPSRSRYTIIQLHQNALNRGAIEVSGQRKKPTTRFNFTKVEFLYDPDDYEYIPGLQRVHDSGFLTPVFFNIEALIKFQNHAKYRVQFGSRTYGHIWRGNEYDIAFGINRSGKLVMWLGDIAKLPEEEQYFLRSENIPSDHDIGSEFYDGQIEVKFTDPPPEDQLMLTRADFLTAAFKRFGLKIDHLSSETLNSMSKLSPPVANTEKEAGQIMGLLNQILVESIDSNNVGSLLQARSENPSKIGSLKRLEKLFTLEFPKQDIRSTFTSFFVLYDLRVLASHSMSEATKVEEWKFACERLGIKETSTYIELYNHLIQELTKSYKTLVTLLG